MVMKPQDRRSYHYLPIGGKMKKCILIQFMILILFLSSCVSYSTLQTPETLAPGHVSLGVGSVINMDNLFLDGEINFAPEVSGRIGVRKGYDIGFKYTNPGIYMIDLKHQFETKNIAVAFDMGVSVSNVSIFDSDFDVFSLGFYPALLMGKKFWYVGVKGTVGVSDLDITDDHLFLLPFISAPSIITGLKIGNEYLKLLLELNTHFGGSSLITILPAAGLYVGF